MNKTLCKEMLVEKRVLNCNYADNKIDVYLHNILYPLFDELVKKIKIDKFYNIKNDTIFDEFYQKFFDNLMSLIEKRIKLSKN